MTNLTNWPVSLDHIIKQAEPYFNAYFSLLDSNYKTCSYVFCAFETLCEFDDMWKLVHTAQPCYEKSYMMNLKK